MASDAKPLYDKGVVEAEPGATPAQKRTGLWVLAATILGSSMAFIDGAVVNVALPVMQVDLNATVADAQWVVESYTLFLSALLLVGGSLGDHFGRKRVFSIGVGIFALASVWCGFAPDAQQLIWARAAQGIGARYWCRVAWRSSAHRSVARSGGGQSARGRASRLSLPC